VTRKGGSVLRRVGIWCGNVKVSQPEARCRTNKGGIKFGATKKKPRRREREEGIMHGSGVFWPLDNEDDTSMVGRGEGSNKMP